MDQFLSKEGDAALTNQIALGDEQAFLVVFNRYIADLTRFIQKFVHAKALADDLAQEVFIKVWEQRTKLTEVDTFKAYLFTIARNHTLNALKKSVQVQSALSVIVRSYVEQRNLTEDDLLDKEYQRLLQAEIDRLPARSREIFHLCREQQRTYEEVASIMGISKNAVKNHMVATMKRLRESVSTQTDISFLILLSLLQ